MRQALAWPMAVGLLMSGCSLAPQYERPAMPVPDAWNQETTAAAGPEATPLPDIPWQEFITDPSLRSVVELAVANNRDLRAAALNVQRARAVFRIQRADLLPNAAATASGDIYRLPAALSDTDKARTIAQYQVGLGVAGWELDFFG
ncbi:MAG: TolC family protein, partial [Deinococcales bacterium]